MRKLRMVHVNLTAQFVVDDGTDLTPLDPQQWAISAADWPHVLDKVAGAMADMQAQLDADDPNRAARRAGKSKAAT